MSPVIVFTLRNEFGEYLAEERRPLERSQPAELDFLGGPVYPSEVYMAALPRIVRSSLGVGLVQAHQLYPQHFIDATAYDQPIWYEDIDGVRSRMFAFIVGAWIGEVGPERRDTHAKLRWVDPTDVEAHGHLYSRLMSHVIMHFQFQ